MRIDSCWMDNSLLARCLSCFRSDEGLTLETSASETLYSGKVGLSTQLIKPNFFIAYDQNEK